MYGEDGQMAGVFGKMRYGIGLARLTAAKVLEPAMLPSVATKIGRLQWKHAGVGARHQSCLVLGANRCFKHELCSVILRV